MKGKVYLVGAGPGDYKLITIKGLEAIRKSDIIVYDRLANENLLKEAKDECEFIYVGKKSNNHTMKQVDINKLLKDKASEGKIVTRLKGGDPYVFGRGGEEGEYLYKKGIDFEVIPGITSAIGGLCYAGIPITNRNYASSFHVITGHLKDDNKELDFKSIASLDGTLVFLMGMRNLKNIVDKLIINGKEKDTPVAIINWATRPYQRVVSGKLDNIVEIVKKEKIKPPSLIVIGEVVNLRDKLNFFENKRLFKKNIVVTRAKHQNSSFIEKINNLGGNAIEFPTIEIDEIIPNEKLAKSIKNLNEYSYIIFTSINGVNIFFDRLYKLGFDCRKLGDLKVVSIGPSTAEALKAKGIKADIIPKKYVGEHIFKTLKKVLKPKDKVLIPRSLNARSYLVDNLSNICSVDEIKIYKTVTPKVDKKNLLEYLDKELIDYITFTSSSTIDNFVNILGTKNLEKIKSVKLVSIGPITSKRIKSYGLKVYKQASEYTIDGLISCIE
ncbi:MAG: uroporphyrinogen-III C-methyltransferase [Firmicutes bacterium]|nr:uroporphyrinogen-III C-methyltransferase [Bacillota bacterium]